MSTSFHDKFIVSWRQTLTVFLELQKIFLTIKRCIPKCQDLKQNSLRLPYYVSNGRKASPRNLVSISFFFFLPFFLLSLGASFFVFISHPLTPSSHQPFSRITRFLILKDSKLGYLNWEHIAFTLHLPNTSNIGSSIETPIVWLALLSSPISTTIYIYINSCFLI